MLSFFGIARGLNFIKQNILSYLVYLSKYDSELAEQLKSKMLEHNIFSTNIRIEKGSFQRSFGGQLSISYISFEPRKKWGLHWKPMEIKQLYAYIVETWNILKKYGSKMPFDSLEAEMYMFLSHHRNELSNEENYESIFSELSEFVKKARGYDTIEEALYSQDMDIYKNGLTELFSEIKRAPEKDNSEFIKIIMTRLLCRDQGGFELSIEIAAVTLQLSYAHSWINRKRLFSTVRPTISATPITGLEVIYETNQRTALARHYP